MLVLDNIEAIYLDVVLALTEVTMRIEDGSIVVLLGNNGSGKSTTLKSISGVLSLEEGRLNTGKIELDGKRIDHLNPEQIARLGLCHVLQGHPVFEELTTEENLIMGAYLIKKRQDFAADLAHIYGYFPKLQKLKERKAGYLSGGEQQMLVIGRALMARPRILLLDEPSLGLAPRVVAEIFEVIKNINKEQHTTFLIAEQNAHAVLAIADYGYILQTARVVLEGKSDVLSSHHDIKKSYLGDAGDGVEKNYYAYLYNNYMRKKRNGLK
jgi:branched-chain amino acid transport system ATP-binding protein